MPTYAFGGFTLDTDTRRLAYGEQPVVLTAKVFDTLALLVEARGEVVERETFQRRLWPDIVVEERNLTVNISTLRRALAEAGGTDCIETVKRIGYRLTLPVDAGTAPPVTAASPMTRTQEESPVEPTISMRKWHVSLRVAFVLGMAVMATATGAISWKMGSATEDDVRVKTGSQTSIAVLPFVGADSSQDAGLGLGLADAVVARLGGIDGVVVRPISAVMPYANGGDPVAIGKSLQVDRVVEGVVHRAGDRAQVNARIVDIATGATVWDERFEHPYSGFFTLQDAVSADVAGALLQRVVVEQRFGSALGRPSNPDAYQAYLEGRMQSSRMNVGIGPIDAAIRAFQRSVALDANFAPAWSALARVYRVRSFSHERRAELVAQSRAAAEKALSIDPRLSEGHLALGLLKYSFDWDWTGAERDIQRAVDLDPQSEDAFNWLGNLLRGLGEYDRAIAAFERARTINPMSARHMQVMGEGFWFAGRIDEAIGMLEQAARLDPSNPTPDAMRIAVYDSVGRSDDAIAAREKTAMLRGDTEYLNGLRLAERDGYRAVLEFDLSWYTRQRELWGIAAISALLNRPEPALAALEECVTVSCSELPILVTEPRLRSLHGHPRFRALAARVNLSAVLARVH